MHAARKEDRRLSAALLAAALAHTPEAEEALRGARTRMARKPAALARELLRNFPKGRGAKGRRRRRVAGSGAGAQAARDAVTNGAAPNAAIAEELDERADLVADDGDSAESEPSDTGDDELEGPELEPASASED